MSMTDRSTLNWRAGTIAGIVGTICYTVFAEGVNVALNGAEAFVIPFRQMGAMLLGPSALNIEYNLPIVMSAGALVHLIVGAVFGIIVAQVAALLDVSRKGRLTLLGTLLGLGLYALNVFVIFPAAFPWFLGNDRLVQSIGHALFGAATGAWLEFLPLTRNSVRPSRTG